MNIIDEIKKMGNEVMQSHAELTSFQKIIKEIMETMISTDFVTEVDRKAFVEENLITL